MRATIITLVVLLAPQSWAGIAVAPADIEITDVGAESGGEFCRSFTLTADQVAEFLKKANEITPRQLHDEFEWLPCFVRGTYRTPFGTAQWEIRAGGTGSVTMPTGKGILLGCQSCADSYK